jgi:hypothetical protein
MTSRTGALLDRSTVSKGRRNAKLTLHHDGVLTGWRRAQLNSKEVEQVRALATVLPELANQGHELYTYFELLAEGIQAAVPIGWHPAGDLLRGLKMLPASEPIARAKVMGSRTFHQVADRSDVVAFVERLLERAPFWPEMEKNFSDFEKENAAKRDRLRELCEGLKPQHYPDALHLWAAEVNGLRYFLTMDGRFCNLMTKTKQIALPCTPLRPTDLMSELGVTSLLPFPALDDDEWHAFHEGHP